MKQLYLVVTALIILIAGCEIPVNDDTNSNSLFFDDILRIEASIFIENDTVQFYYSKDKIIKTLSSHYIWFNTIEGNNSVNGDIFKSDFDASVLGKDISGFFEMIVTKDVNDIHYVEIAAKRISENATSKKTYELITNEIREVSNIVVDGKREITFLSVGLSVCDTTLISTTYELAIKDSYTETMIGYYCNDRSEIKVTIYYSN